MVGKLIRQQSGKPRQASHTWLSSCSLLTTGLADAVPRTGDGSGRSQKVAFRAFGFLPHFRLSSTWVAGQQSSNCWHPDSIQNSADQHNVVFLIASTGQPARTPGPLVAFCHFQSPFHLGVQIQEKPQAWLEGELKPTERRGLARHPSVKECSKARSLHMTFFCIARDALKTHHISCYPRLCPVQ